MSTSNNTSHTFDPPESVMKDIISLPVRFINFKGVEQEGRIEVHILIEQEIRGLFELIYELQFPLESVIPFSECRKSDDYSMSINNSYAFGYRTITGKPKELSIHAYGCAIDINPRQNPYLNNELVLPPDASYHSDAPGTLTNNHPIVQYMKEHGFVWGGDWDKAYKDYHHFQKPLTG